MKTIGLLLGMVMVDMMFFHPPVFAELIQGTVSGVDANANVVEVIYEDSESGELQEVNLAFVPPPETEVKPPERNDLEVGDEVLIHLKRDRATGMYEASLVKLSM